MLDASLRIPEGVETVVDGKKTTDLSLVTEMLRLRAVSHSKYLITVKAPDVKGMHDDESDAYSRAVYLATEYQNSGGGIVKNNRIESTGGAATYKQYHMKQKRGALYTKRPSSAIQMEVSRNRTYSSLGMGGLSRESRR